MEAYQVLSKSHSRANYDMSLRGIDTIHYVKRDIVYEPWKVDPTRYAEQGPDFSPYYGVKGWKKTSNWRIVVACLVFCACGVVLQAAAIFRSVTFKRENLDRVSEISSVDHKRVREEAEANGNTIQIERLKQRMVKSSEMYFGKVEE